MKTELTIEESGKLIELGVDKRYAELKITHYEDKPTEIKRVFTLTGILSILPKEIGNYELNISVTEEEYFVSYILWDSMDDVSYIRDVRSGDQFSAPELIDALNQLLIWAIENRHINLNTPKK